MKWDYRTIKLAAEDSVWGGKFDAAKLDQVMNNAGSDGWELVTAFGTNQSLGATGDAVLVFKRPRER